MSEIELHHNKDNLVFRPEDQMPEEEYWANEAELEQNQRTRDVIDGDSCKRMADIIHRRGWIYEFHTPEEYLAKRALPAGVKFNANDSSFELVSVLTTELKLSSSKIAPVIGWGVSTVSRARRQMGISTGDGRGGQNRSHKSRVLIQYYLNKGITEVRELVAETGMASGHVSDLRAELKENPIEITPEEVRQAKWEILLKDQQRMRKELKALARRPAEEQAEYMKQFGPDDREAAEQMYKLLGEHLGKDRA